MIKRTPIWQSIAAALTGDIADGHYGPGDKLPTEASLAARFGVNRHTVRHALKALAGQGLVHARRGAGVFVTQVPTDYPIGRRVRFHQNLTAAGQLPAKEILSLETRSADDRERAALRLNNGDQVHVYDSLSLADGQAIAVSQSVFPAARFPGLLGDLQSLRSVTKALSKQGVSDYIRIETRLTATAATPTQSLHLRLPEGAPMLRSVGINADPEGNRVEYGRTWFAGDRVTLTLSGD